MAKILVLGKTGMLGSMVYEHLSQSSKHSVFATVRGKGNIEKSNNGIIKAQAIVKEFQATLDMNYEVSENLDSIYDYMYRRLVEANLKKDSSIIEEVLGYAKGLRDTWAQAMKLAKHPVPVAEGIAK